MGYTQRSVVLFGLAVFAFLGLLGVTIFLETRSQLEGMLYVSFLDVGQGDAIFIQAPNGKQMLIDGGPDRGVLRELGGVMPFWDRSIDVVLATHPDKDHIGGLISVFEFFRVSHYIASGKESDTDSFERLEEVVKEEQLQSRANARRDSMITLDHESGVFFEILEPDSSVDEISDSNDASVVGRLVYGDVSFLLTGDASTAVEIELVREVGEERLRSEVLKLGHHGSKTSSSLLFLDTVDPRYAIISAGRDNRYGHPHDEVVERLERLSVPYIQTATEGTITFQTNGKELVLR